jgi:adenine phosphoribosyltransferase
MKNTTEILQEYKARERAEHINIDDILNKVTQEIIELLEGIKNNDMENITEEAGDVLINLLSFASELWLDVNALMLERNEWEGDLLDLFGHWNEQVQALRWKYSRKQNDLPEVESLTKSFISTVLNYTDPNKNIWEVIETNLSKLMDRKDMYKPEINVKDYIAEYPDFPKPGINFKDISPILANPDAMRYVCHEMAEKCRWADKIVALDARGFIFAPIIAEILWRPWVMARKPGKLPWETVSISYDLEYGSNMIELQKNAIVEWEKIAIVDDLLATGGTAMATIKLIEKLGWIVTHAAFTIGLEDEFLLWKQERKDLAQYPHSSVVSYND